jgi:hypothetical protein
MAMGRTQRNGGDHHTALVHIQEALSLYRRAVTDQPDNRNFRAAMASCESILGTLRANLNQLTESCGNFRRSIALWDELLRLDPANTHYQRQQMLAYGHLEMTEQAMRRLETRHEASI